MVSNLGKIPRLAAQLQNYDRHPPKPLKAKECDMLEGIIRDISSIEAMTPKIEKADNLRAHLEIMIGNYPRVKHEYQFPDPLPDKAAAVLEKYEAINWGATEEPDVEEIPTSPTSQTAPVRRPRPRTPSSPIRKRSRSPPRIPRIDHPIFGEKGIMRGIMINSGPMVSYLMNPRFPNRNCNVVGHNGLEVGDWWPLQICALRDGAHGARISGIAGSKANGAYSIVVSGKYENLDADRGDMLSYSGSQALENTDPEVPIISPYTEALRLSFQLRRPLRVLRCSRSNSPYSPSKGIRYDGLYTITGEETRFNTHGGAYIRFKLTRNANQLEIDLTRPTAREKTLCDRVRLGY